MEAVVIKTSQQLLIGSALDSVGGNVFDDEITGGSDPGRSRLFDDIDDDDLLFDE